MRFYKSVFDNHISEGKKYHDFALKFSEVWFENFVCCCYMTDYIKHFAKDLI